MLTRDCRVYVHNFVHNGVAEKSNSNQHPVMWGQFDDNWILMDWR